MTVALVCYGGFLAIIWCCIGWSMYRAPTDVELWGKKWNNTSSLISKILLSEPRQEDFIFRTEPM